MPTAEAMLNPLQNSVRDIDDPPKKAGLLKLLRGNSMHTEYAKNKADSIRDIDDVREMRPIFYKSRNWKAFIDPAPTDTPTATLYSYHSQTEDNRAALREYDAWLLYTWWVVVGAITLIMPVATAMNQNTIAIGWCATVLLHRHSRGEPRPLTRRLLLGRDRLLVEPRDVRDREDRCPR